MRLGVLVGVPLRVLVWLGVLVFEGVCVPVPDRERVPVPLGVVLEVILNEGVSVVVGVPVGEEPVVEVPVGVAVLEAVIEPVRLIV